MFTSKKAMFLVVCAFTVVCTGIVLGRAAAAASAYGPVPMPTPGVSKKYEYKGIWIGMAADAVRAKLGNPKEKADGQDLYVFSDNEAVQFYYNTTHQVNAIMITFSGDLKSAPSAKDVFGEEVPPKADGGIFKMERYPKDGYWMSYNRTGGSDAVVTIAIQKI